MTPSIKQATGAKIEPLLLLRSQIVTLDAAMLVAVTSTEAGAVHKLRTATRRVQAHLLLLDALHHHSPGRTQLPPHAGEEESVLKLLGNVRRAAGSVRDLDVQTSMIRLDAPQKSAVHKGSTGDKVRTEARKLRKHLERRRDAKADKLLALLRSQEADLAAAMRALEKVLKPARRRAVSVAWLREAVHRRFLEMARQQVPAARAGKQQTSAKLQQSIEVLSDEALHSLRKAAKLCRYMAEGAPDDAEARQLAQTLEALQEAGGRWHDWMMLEELSMEFHGKGAELSHRYAKHRAAAQAEYQVRLRELFPAMIAGAEKTAN